MVNSSLWRLSLGGFSNINVGVGIKEKAERMDTSCDSDHMDMWDHLCVHLGIGGNTGVNVEGCTAAAVLTTWIFWGSQPNKE